MDQVVLYKPKTKVLHVLFPSSLPKAFSVQQCNVGPHLAVLAVLKSTRRVPRGMASSRITSAVMLLVAGTSTSSAGPAVTAALQARPLHLRCTRRGSSGQEHCCCSQCGSDSGCVQ